jgi:hypothetical protein
MVRQRPDCARQQLLWIERFPVLRSGEHGMVGCEDEFRVRSEGRQLLGQNPCDGDDPWLQAMVFEDGLGSALTPLAEWYPCAGANCAKDNTCGISGAGGRINYDNLDTWLETGLSCSQAWLLNLSVYIRVCASSSCEDAMNKNKLIEIPATGLAQALGCPLRLPNTCTEGSGLCLRRGSLRKRPGVLDHSGRADDLLRLRSLRSTDPGYAHELSEQHRCGLRARLR